jgi:hypothetical protein
VHVTGTGDPSVRYGIEQRNANLHGVSFDYGATDIEIDHLEVHHNGYLGIGVQAYPRCDGLHHRGNFEQRNTLVHDNYVHHATTGEGMYIGSSHYELDVPSGYILDCPETGYLEPPLINVRVYDNLVEDVGRDGIQVGAAIHGMEIAHNVVRRYAILHDYGQVGGLQINPGSVGLIHHNRIESFEGDVDGTAIQYAGGNTEDTEIYDNVIVGSPTPFLTLGYMIDDTHQTSFHHNTIVDRLVALPNGMHNHPLALDLYCNAMLPTATPHRVSMLDNIFVGYDWIGPFVYNDGTDDWFKIFDSHASLCPIDGVVYESAREPDVTVQGNFFSHDVADAQFVDAAAGDYHVSSGSPAAGMGARD